MKTNSLADLKSTSVHDPLLQENCKSPDRKCQDYVYVKREYQSTMHKIKHYLRPRNKANGNMALSYCKALRWTQTRQIWGIWKLRPAYSPETPNLGQSRWCFVPCDLEIWWMTLENNMASLLRCFKLCASFRSHWWIQTGVTVRKRPIWVKFDDF